MGKILIFNYCSIPIFLIILYTNYVRRVTKGSANRLFFSIICVALVSALCDIVADGYEPFLPLSATGVKIVAIANYAYFYTRNLIPPMYLVYLLASTRTGFYLRNRLSKFLITLPYLILLGFLFTNPFHHKVFTVTAEEGYVRGPLLIIFYVISIFYSLLGVIYLFYCSRFFKQGKWISLMSMYFLGFVGVFIQYFFPNMLIEIFSMSIAFLMVILLVMRPEETIDVNVGLPGWRAYREELEKIVKLKRPVHINVVRYINAPQVREYLGEEKYNKYIMEIARVVEDHRVKNNVSAELYYEAPGNIYFIIEKKFEEVSTEEMFRAVSNQIRNATQDIEKAGVYLRPRMCRINFPQDVNTVEGIIQLGHSFPEMLKEGQRCINASELVGTQRYKIEMNITTILTRAITNKSFTMNYQPIYSMKDGKFHSAEALIRLTDAEYGFISPGIFIPEAERRGLIISIGDFVLETVFKFISEHNLNELGLNYIEINLSVAQCFQIDLADKIFALKEKYGIDPSSVNFEITETTYNDIGNLAQKNIEKLVNAGFSFSLDDYGTGYSNIQRIVKLPLSLIKLDKSLIDEIVNDDGSSVIRNTIKMMKDIRKHVLAEGVETKEQLGLLREMNCDYIQGFYFSKALPEDEFIKFIKDNQ